MTQLVFVDADGREWTVEGYEDDTCHMQTPPKRGNTSEVGTPGTSRSGESYSETGAPPTQRSSSNTRGDGVQPTLNE